MDELISREELLESICGKRCEDCIHLHGDCKTELRTEDILKKIVEIPVAYDVEYKALQIEHMQRDYDIPDKVLDIVKEYE